MNAKPLTPLFIGLLLSFLSPIAQADPLPQPLTLEAALTLADDADPLLRQREAERRLAMAERSLMESESGFDVRVRGRLRWVEPADGAVDPGPDDHLVGVVATKRLYDFGGSSARESAAEAELRRSQWRYRQAAQQRRIAIMTRFFDVLLADQTFARDNEAMSVAYVSMDKLRNRYELGQVSDIDMVDAESAYQQSRHQRAISEARQRASRSQLAIALNAPDDLPADLLRPTLSELSRELPGYEALLAEALNNNPLLKSQREAVAAAQRRVTSARLRRAPVIAGEVAATEYSREKGSNDEWYAGITLEVPLYSGGAIGAGIAREQASLYRAQATLQESEHALRQAVLDEWLGLASLKSKLEQILTLEDYRALYLDRSRANYEMEVQTDLGDAMVKLSDAELERLKAEYAMALTWARLDALLGREVASEHIQKGGVK